MTQFTAIDLENLPSPDIIETLDFEQIFDELLNDLTAILPDFTVRLESDPVYKILAQAAYREIRLRARINDATRAVMLAFATGADLDQIAARFNIVRQVVDNGDPLVTPPIAPTLESNERLRERTQLSFEGLTTAGPIGSYRFHALSASPEVKDVDINSPTPGVVDVTVLSHSNNGVPTTDLLNTVDEQLNDERIRPLTDLVNILSPQIVFYDIVTELVLFEGPDAEVVRQAAESALLEYAENRHRLGHDITLSGVYRALHQPGVQNVMLNLQNDIVINHNQAPRLSSFSVIIGGIDE